jgi:hypothetical protein
MADIGYFLGRFHVLVLHVPIAVVIAAVVLQWVARRPRYRQLRPALPFFWGAAAASATLTAVLGYLHFAEGGFTGSSANAHRLYGTSVAIGTTLIWLACVRWPVAYQRVEVAAGVLVLVLLTLTGHHGGNLTHGATYLVEYAPGPLRELVGVVERRFGAGSRAAADAQALSAADREIVAALADSGFLVRHVSQSDPRLVVSVYSPGTVLTAEQVAALDAAAPYIVDLDLQRSGLDDAALASLDGFSELTKLRLSRNRLTDHALNALAELPKLESLNLYGNTAITDAGLEDLARIVALRRVYLWETGVTAAGLERLERLRPDLTVQTATAPTLTTGTEPRN